MATNKELLDQMYGNTTEEADTSGISGLDFNFLAKDATAAQRL